MPQLSDQELSSFCQQIQHNCAISDARFARDYSLCVYLLRMREFYRWQQDIPLSTPIDTGEVGDWISSTELAWEELEEKDYQQLQFRGHSFDPFDSGAVNAVLQKHDLVYTAGIGRMGQAHFLLASLDNTTQPPSTGDCGITVFECGTEYARDSITLPAMAQGQSVFIRRDSLARMLWQMIDEWRLNPRAGPMQRLLEHFAIDPDNVDDTRLSEAARQLSWLVREHEYGEVEAGRLLGEQWSAMTRDFIRKPGEYYLRAVRDMIADTLHGWPAIIRSERGQYLDFWLAGVNGVREKWLSQTGTLAQLEQQQHDERLRQLRSIQAVELQRWLAIAETLKAQYRLHGADFAVEETVAELLEGVSPAG